MDANGYNRDLSRSEQKTKDFERNIRSNINKAASTFTKLAGAVGVGVTAFELFDKTIKASETTADAYDKIMRAATTTVNSFFTAISTGDFSVFSAGLDGIINKAMAAAEALDQLGNTTMSYNYFSTRNQAEFADAIAVLRDKSSTADEKAKAQATVDRIMGSQKEITEEMARRTQEAVSALVVEGNRLDASMVTRDVIDKIIALDVTTVGDAEKKRLEERYKQYQKILNETMSRHTTTTYSSSNWGTQSQSITNQEAVDRELAAVNAEYLDAIAYNEILVKHNDDWLNNLIGIVGAADNATRAYANMAKQAARLSEVTGGSSSGGGSSATVYGAGSLGLINQQLSLLQKQFEAATDEGTRIGIQKAINDLEAKKQEITFYANVKARGINAPGNISPEGLQIAGTSLDIGKLKNISKSDWTQYKFSSEDADAAYSYADGLTAIGNAMGFISNMTDEGAAAWLQWGTNVMSAIAQALPQIQTLIAAKTAEGAVSAGASAAQTPLVGWLLAGGAIAAFLAAVASIPKFAEGGIVGGSSFFGDKNLARLNSGEMVLTRGQQAKLFDMIDNGIGGRGGQVEFKIKGQELYGVLTNYKNKRSKVR